MQFCSPYANAKVTVKQNASCVSKLTFPTHAITDLYRACNTSQSGSGLHVLLSG